MTLPANMYVSIPENPGKQSYVGVRSTRTNEYYLWQALRPEHTARHATTAKEGQVRRVEGLGQS